MSALLQLYCETGYNAKTCETLETAFRGRQFSSLLVFGSHLRGKSTVLKELLQLGQLSDCESRDDILVLPEVWTNQGTDILLLEASTGTSVFPKALSISSICLLVFHSWKHVVKVVAQINSLEPQVRPELFILIRSEDRADEWQMKQERELSDGHSFHILDRSDLNGVRNELAQVFRRTRKYRTIEAMCSMVSDPEPFPLPMTSVQCSKPRLFQPLTDVDFEQRTPLCLFAASSTSLHLSKNTLSVLWGNFKDCTNICPFLVLGHAKSGKSALLDAVLGEGSLFCSVEREEGLYVWPHPLNSSGVSVMLMELSGLNFAERSICMDKLAAVSLALSSACGVCLKKGSFFANLHSILKIGETAAGLLSPPSKYLVFVDREEISEAKWTSKMAKNAAKYHGHNIIPLGRELAGPSIALISDVRKHLLDCTKDFQSLSADQEQPSESITKFAYFADLCTKIANITETLTEFNIQFPHFKRMYESNFPQFEKFQNWRELARNASKLQLFKRTWDSIDVREDTLETLTSNFDMQGETVVLVVFGAPGVGKSTLLNHIVRYTGSLPLREIFPTGSTTTHTTQESEVLSCPLWVGANRDKQCLLIDLEGLGGSETISLTSLTGQDRIVTGILALASIPCIVIHNQADSIGKLKKWVRLISELQQFYKYDVDRIVLLFHDRHEAADFNRGWNAALQEIQNECFGGRAVFRVLNKPSFVSSDVEQREKFLSKLLDECEFPRRKQGQPVPLSTILKEISAIAHSLESVDTLMLTPDEEVEYDHIEKQIFEQLEFDIDTLKSNDTKELLPVFDTYLDRLKKDPKILRCRVIVQRKVLDQLKNRSNQIRLDLLRFEAFNLQTKFLRYDQIILELQQFKYEAKLYFKSQTSSFSPFHYWNSFDEQIKDEFDQLHGRMEQTSLHFPTDHYNKMMMAACNDVRNGHRDGGELRKLQALPLDISPEEPFILVVGGSERFLFCDLLVKSLKPLTFPKSQIFTEGNQYFRFTYSSSNLPREWRIVSFELTDYHSMEEAAKLLSQAAIAYILIDSPTPVAATESMLGFYSHLRKDEDRTKPVTFLCRDKADISRCQNLAITYFSAEYKQAYFKPSNPALLEASYRVPKVLIGL